jgi:hypothetical protein
MNESGRRIHGPWKSAGRGQQNPCSMSRSCRVELPVGFGNRWKTTRTKRTTRDMKSVEISSTDFVFFFDDQSFGGGGHGRNRTGVHGFAVRCVTTPPRGHYS